MDSEKWIWLELFAFDPEKDDCGVESYIKNAGFIPNGVSLLLNAIDFVLLYNGMDREYPLFDEVNGRGSGHKKWTNYRLRQLINELQKNGIKVFFSVFTFYWKNKSRTEFIAAHPECAVVYSEQGKTRAVDVLAKLDNGQYLEDIFAANLYRIMCDYRFNGWHGPDWFGPGGSLKGSCSDNIVSQFIEFLGGNIPEGLEPITDDQPEKLVKRVKFITEKYYLQWCDFLMYRWEIFWQKMTDTVKKANGECMINSPMTRSAWESGVSSGMDYKRIAAMGVKYLLVETVSANFDLCSGTDKVKDRIAIYNAVLQELKMSVPEMKLIFLHCIKDAGESYDVIRHAPGKLEHEFFRLANLFYRDGNNKLNRCADGFMVCLGNTIKPYEWDFMRQFWQASFDFTPAEAGDFTWLFDYSGINDWRLKYLRYRTPSPSAISAYFAANYNLHSPVICQLTELENLNTPAAMFNFDCCSAEQIESLLNFKKAPLLLLGNIKNICIPEKSAVFTVPESDENYQFGCIILNSSCQIENKDIKEKIEFFDNLFVPIFAQFPAMKLPAAFWDAVADAWGRTLDSWHGNTRTRPVKSEKIRTFNMKNSQGRELLVICSYAPHYVVPELYFNSPETKVRKLSSFPEFELLNCDGKLWTEIPYTPPNIPPMGIMTLEINSAQTDKK